MINRLFALIGFLICTSLIGAALYFQYMDNLEPCPLCIFQRVAFILLGVIFLAYFLHNPRGFGRRIYGFVGLVAGALGISIAGRHVWLQNLPADQVPECGPGLDYMLDVFPMGKVLEKVFKGSGECAEVSWTFLSISMPGWSLIWFVVLTLITIKLLFGKK